MRGRPKGSKNKVNIQTVQETAVPLDIREVKRQIRMLRKIKKDTHKKTAERRELNEKIRELKKQLIPFIQAVEPEKQVLIDQILKKRPEYIRLSMNLSQFSMKQLQHHLEYIKDKPNLL